MKILFQMYGKNLGHDRFYASFWIFEKKIKVFIYVTKCTLNLNIRTILSWNFAKFVENVLGSIHALILKLPIQTSLSVAPELQVFTRSAEKCENFSETSTPLFVNSQLSCMFSPEI